MLTKTETTIVTSRKRRLPVQEGWIQKTGFQEKIQLTKRLRMELECLFKSDTLRQFEDLFNPENGRSKVLRDAAGDISERIKKDREAKDSAWQRFDEMSKKYNYFN